MINRNTPYFNNLTWKLDLNKHRKTISDSGYLVTGQNNDDKKQTNDKENQKNQNKSNINNQKNEKNEKVPIIN